jgi:catechol 2,3-dioxygenase-like lactoylglutathione lyase family enzyme
MPHINQVSVVIVPVRDQDEAVDFYTRVLGFGIRSDFTYETGERWVEVVAPGAPTSLTLVKSDAAGIETRVILSSTDVEGDRAEFAATGVDVSEILGHDLIFWGGAPLAGNPAMFFLRDPDGNSLLIVAAP